MVVGLKNFRLEKDKITRIFSHFVFSITLYIDCIPHKSEVNKYLLLYSVSNVVVSFRLSHNKI